MTARNAVRLVRSKVTRPGFGPVVGPDYWSPHPLDRPSAPLDYAVGCADPIEEEPERLVAPAALGVLDIALPVSVILLGGGIVWLVIASAGRAC